MTASEGHVPERRQDQRRRVAQPAFYGENRTTARRTDDTAESDAPEGPAQNSDAHDSEVSPPAEGSASAAISQQDYAFLTGLISMEHSG